MSLMNYMYCQLKKKTRYEKDIINSYVNLFDLIIFHPNKKVKYINS